MTRFFSTLLALLILISCSSENSTAQIPDSVTPGKGELARQNLERAIALTDTAIEKYFTGDEMKMSRAYNPFSQTQSSEVASVWMYSAAMEAVAEILSALDVQKSENPGLHQAHFARYAALFERLYDNMDYYLGTYTLTSYTQTREWSVYGVNRAAVKGTARVDGVENVYDDQEWLVKILLIAYRHTGEKKYLAKAEMLADYVLDGWDCTLDAQGRENGGITWGPGYTTKHSCSNGPMVAPLVELYNIYKKSGETIEHRYITPEKKRLRKNENKSEYYLDFARRIYAWQQEKLLRPEDGVYADLYGGCSDCGIKYEVIDGEQFRTNTPMSKREGRPYSYNSGTMLSGAAALYEATGEKSYLQDLQTLSDNCFRHFARLDADIKGHYTYDVSGFSPFFNSILLTGWVSCHGHHPATSTAIESFQANLDYAYSKHLQNGLLPANLLLGWNRDTGKASVDGQFIFAYAIEYAALSIYNSTK